MLDQPPSYIFDQVMSSDHNEEEDNDDNALQLLVTPDRAAIHVENVSQTESDVSITMICPTVLFFT